MEGLILEDAAIRIRISDARFTGATPVFTGNVVDIIAKAKSIEYTEETQKANVSGASGVKRNRYHSDEYMMTLKGIIDTSGTLFAAAFASPLRKNIEVTYLPNSSLTTGWTKVGVITKFANSGTQGDATTEQIDVDLSADYVAAGGGGS